MNFGGRIGDVHKINDETGGRRSASSVMFSSTHQLKYFICPHVCDSLLLFICATLFLLHQLMILKRRRGRIFIRGGYWGRVYFLCICFPRAAITRSSGGRPSTGFTGEDRETPRAILMLANILTALYPKDSGEKRLLDAMLLARPR